MTVVEELRKNNIGVVILKEDGTEEKVSLDDPRLEGMDWTLPDISDSEIEEACSASLFEVCVEEFGEELARKMFSEEGLQLPIISKVVK